MLRNLHADEDATLSLDHLFAPGSGLRVAWAALASVNVLEGQAGAAEVAGPAERARVAQEKKVRVCAKCIRAVEFGVVMAR